MLSHSSSASRNGGLYRGQFQQRRGKLELELWRPGQQSAGLPGQRGQLVRQSASSARDRENNVSRRAHTLDVRS